MDTKRILDALKALQNDTREIKAYIKKRESDDKAVAEKRAKEIAARNSEKKKIQEEKLRRQKRAQGRTAMMRADYIPKPGDED